MIAAANPIASIQAELRDMATEELRQEFRSGLRLSIDHLTRLALVLAELESRGEQVQGVNAGLLSLLRSIVRGDMLAETIVTFAANPTVMRKVGRLPVQEQRRIIQDEEECERLMKPQKRKRKTAASQAESQVRIGSRNFRDIAKAAVPKDLAGMIAEMILENDDPKAVLGTLLQEPEIKRLMS